ncbi:MAG TPA: alanine--glyoxylate aminotransferase family protein [Deinococcales bacterium]|nr:alanine--glyoxylate aminotransferase family protein [Deinococcales bacterium]
MTPRPRLLTPGPVELAPEVLQALAGRQLHHRSPEGRAAFQRARALLAGLFGAPLEAGWETLILTTSGTGAMEAGLNAVLRPGDEILALANGKFGQRWQALARRLGLTVQELNAPWGRALDPAEVESALDARPDVKAVVFTHSETSTGTLNDAAGIAAAVRRAAPDALLIADTVTSLAVAELRPVEWTLDVAASGSQKGVGGPPGLGFLALSPRALQVVNALPAPNAFTLDVRRELAAQPNGETAFTPAINLVAALLPSLERLASLGLETVWAERAAMSASFIAAAEALGGRAYSSRPSPACAAIVPPAPVTGTTLVRAMKARGAHAQRGQDQIEDLIARVSFMGHFDRYDALAVAGLLEDALSDLDVPFRPGAGVAAAWEVLRAGGR